MSLVTLFWLGVNAARKNTLWGMLVLLLSPVSAVIYGIKYWQDSRLPFLAYSLSLVSAITLGAYLLHASGTWQVMQTSMHMHQAILSKDLSGRDALSFTPVRLTDFAQVTPHERQQRRLQLMHDFVDRYEPSFTEADREEINQTISRLMYGTTVTGELGPLGRDSFRIFLHAGMRLRVRGSVSTGTHAMELRHPDTDSNRSAW